MWWRLGSRPRCCIRRSGCAAVDYIDIDRHSCSIGRNDDSIGFDTVRDRTAIGTDNLGNSSELGGGRVRIHLYTNGRRPERRLADLLDSESAGMG